MGWASTPRLLASQARRFCCALLQISHPNAARMTAIQGRLADDDPVFASTEVSGLDSGVGVGVGGVLGSGLGVGPGVTLGSGVGPGVTLGSGVGVGGVGSGHSCVELSHSTQPFPSHISTEGVAWDVPPKRDSVPMNPRRIAARMIPSGVLLSLDLVTILPS